MFLYRYMSMDEFTSMLAGADINGSTRCHHCRTESEGVCFLPEIIHAWNNYSSEEYNFTPNDAYSFLNGIVSRDVLVAFWVEDISIFRSGYAIYADPYSSGWDDTISIRELSTPFYNRELLTPCAYCVDREHWGFGYSNEWWPIR